MVFITAKELRTRLSYYLDELERGKEITIVRHSLIIGRLVPSEEVKNMAESEEGNRDAVFRKFGVFENPEPIKQLQLQAIEEAGGSVDNSGLDIELANFDNPASVYEKLGGEFWVGEQNDEIIAMGGFRLSFGTPSQSSLQSQVGGGAAELKHLQVNPETQDQHLDSQLLKLLEDRARKRGYKVMVFDICGAKEQEPARNFYEKCGYHETGREQAEQFERIYYAKSLA